jgi:hypothetical protein
MKVGERRKIEHEDEVKTKDENEDRRTTKDEGRTTHDG